jgi:hypothetical protein
VKLNQAIFVLGFVLLMNFHCLGKSWNGITPFLSNRADVEKILGIGIGSDFVAYETKKEIVYIDYYVADPKCCERMTNQCWRIPNGTVAQIVVSPKKGLLIEKLKINLATFEKEEKRDDVKGIFYVDRNDGFIIDASSMKNGTYVQFIFLPSKIMLKEKTLDCKLAR